MSQPCACDAGLTIPVHSPTNRSRVCACVCVCVFVCMLRAVLLLIYLGSLHVPSCRQRPGLPIAVLQTDWQRCVWPDRPVQDGCVRLVWWYADGVVDDAGHGQAVTVDSQHLGSRCILLSDPGTNGGKRSQYRGVRPQPALCERNRKEALHKHASTTCKAAIHGSMQYIFIKPRNKTINKHI